MQRMIGYNNFIDERMGLVEAIYENYEVLVEEKKRQSGTQARISKKHGSQKVV